MIPEKKKIAIKATIFQPTCIYDKKWMRKTKKERGMTT